MSLLITRECIACAACLPECPNEAIYENRSDCESKGFYLTDTKDGVEGQLSHAPDDTIYVITSDRCTECVGHFDEPQCAAVCPVSDCCISDMTFPETTQVLLDKAILLNPGKEIIATKVWAGVRN
ncbi:MAG: 4Fe-4S ferredoxin [Nitrospirota bacterium]